MGSWRRPARTSLSGCGGRLPGTPPGDRGKTSRAMEADLELEGSEGAVEEADLGGEEEEMDVSSVESKVTFQENALKLEGVAEVVEEEEAGADFRKT